MSSSVARKLSPETGTTETGDRRQRSQQKVINFFEEQARRQGRPLSEREQDALVIEFRAKARKLARSLLRRWNSRLDIQEVDSIVDLSLCEAVRRFDPTRGASFMTFLYYHLKGNLVRAISYAMHGLAGSLEYSELMSMAEERPYGINASEIAESLVGNGQVQPDEALFKKQLIALSSEACEALDALEKEIIQRMYLEGEQVQDIAASLGYSRCHISRVKKKALNVLNKSMRHSIGEEEALFKSSRSVQRRRPRCEKELPRSIRVKRERLVANE